MGKIIVAILFCLLTPQVGAQGKRIVVQGQIGAIHYPFKEWRPTPTVGINSIIFLPRRFSVLLLASRDIERRSKMVYVVAVQRVFWSK